MEFRNYMEVIVRDELAKLGKSVAHCDCEKCRHDIMAYALNNLPPRYIVSNEFYPRLDLMRGQYAIDIMAKLVEGIELVNNNPRHDENP